MGRRTLLMIAAVVIAAVGAAMIFLYVRGISDRAEADQAPVEVLAVTKQIEAGETVDDAVAAGKLDLKSFPEKDLLDGAMTDTAALKGQVALTTIYPGEQLIPSKFGAPGTQQTITIPEGTMAVSVSLTDPARVAGFITPGAKVAVFASGTTPDAANADADPGATSGGTFTRLLLPSVDVIGVGTTTVLSTTTTDETGAATTEQLPKTLLTLALTQAEAEKVIFASNNGQLALGLLNKNSKVSAGQAVTFESLFAR